MTWEILIPLEIPSQNRTERGRNCIMRAKATGERRSAWKIHGMVERMRQEIPEASGHRSCHIVAYRKRLAFDIANVIGGAKACIDGLVDARLLQDDRDQRATITYEQRLASVRPDKRPCTIIRLS
jgi:hypothetical protein